MPTATAGSHTPSGPMPNATASVWVNKYLAGIKPQGHILDVAAGSGRHTRLALSAGYSVTAIDRDISGLADLTGHNNLTAVEHDLESSAPWPFSQTYDGLVVTNYLWRPILPSIVAAVGCSGVLIYETFGRGNERYGRPKNPDFLLQPGELCEAIVGQLTPIAYQHVTIQEPKTLAKRVVSRLCAIGPDHHWHTDPPSL